MIVCAPVSETGFCNGDLEKVCCGLPPLIHRSPLGVARLNSFFKGIACCKLEQTHAVALSVSLCMHYSWKDANLSVYYNVLYFRKFAS